MIVINLHYPENCTVILSTTLTKSYHQTTNSSSVAHPHLWQLHTAARRHGSSIHSVILSKPETNNGHTTSYMHCSNDTAVHLFSSWWHIQHFSGLLALVFLLWLSWAIKDTQPFYAIQMPYHTEKWRRMCPKHIICPPAMHRKKKD